MMIIAISEYFFATFNKMLEHTNVKTTQIYAKVVDEKKEKAANAIKLNISK